MIMLSSPPEQETWQGFLGRNFYRINFTLVFSPWLAGVLLRLGRRFRLLKKHRALRLQDPHFKVAMVFAILISQLVVAFYSAKDVPQSVYQFLGVPVDVDYKAAKKAFNYLAKTKHPDHGGLESYFIAMQEALSTIQNTTARRHHDFFGYTPSLLPGSCFRNLAETAPLTWEGRHCDYANAVVASEYIGLVFPILFAFMNGLSHWSWIFIIPWFNLLVKITSHSMLIVYRRAFDTESVFPYAPPKGWTTYQFTFFLHDLTPSLLFAIALCYYIYFPKPTRVWRTAIYVQGRCEAFENNMWWRHSAHDPNILLRWFTPYVPKLSYTIRVNDGAYFVVFESERYAKLAASIHSRTLNASLTHIWPIEGSQVIEAFNVAHKKHLAGEEAKYRKKDLSKAKRMKIKNLVTDTRRFASYLRNGYRRLASSDRIVLGDILLLSAIPVDFVSLYYLDFSFIYFSFVSFQVGFAASISFIINTAYHT